MIEQPQETAEDLQEALLTHRPVRPHGPYQVLIGDDRLEFVSRLISDPVPTGNQILQAAGIEAKIDYAVYQMLSDGMLEEIRPDETTDLRSSGVEKFLIFRTDRSFRFLLNDREFDWGSSRISGLTLKKLAGVEPAPSDVWFDVRGGVNVLIEDRELFDLSAPGVERFYTRPKSFAIVVNGRPKELHQNHLSFWDVVKLAYPDAGISQTTIYSVMYKRGPVHNPEGSMVDEQKVELKNGMLFNVTRTDKS
jgi:hypothetical protein